MHLLCASHHLKQCGCPIQYFNLFSASSSNNSYTWTVGFIKSPEQQKLWISYLDAQKPEAGNREDFQISIVQLEVISSVTCAYTWSFTRSTSGYLFPYLAIKKIYARVAQAGFPRATNCISCNHMAAPTIWAMRRVHVRHTCDTGSYRGCTCSV